MSKTRVGLVGTVLALALTGCGGLQYTVVGQGQAAGADGTVAVEAQDGGNFVVNIAMEHLLPPARFGEGLTTYVVWFQPPEQQPSRVGTLAYDEGDREGLAMATTSDTTFEVLVTGESEAAPVSPSENVVFRQAVNASR